MDIVIVILQWYGGEQPLPKDGACNLGSINISEFIDNHGKFEFDEFERVVGVCVKALDDVLEEGKDLHALENQREMAKSWRNIGLGLMGIGSALIKMKISYGSTESIKFLESVGESMINSALLKSSILAKEKGSFPALNNRQDLILNSDFINTVARDDVKVSILENGLRNNSLLSIAPSGSIGTLLGISTGVEPYFRFSYQRKTESLHKGEDVYYDVNVPIAQEYFDNNPSEESLPSYFIDSSQINWRDRVKFQATLQKYIDTAISSTVNLPEETTVEETLELYLESWKQGIKGITIYRSGCNLEGILTVDKKEDEPKVKEGFKLPRGIVEEVNDQLIGRKRKLRTGCGSLYVSLFFDPNDGEPKEIWLSKGSEGGCVSNLTALSRMISLAFRGGIAVEGVVDQLGSALTCPSYTVRRVTKKDTSRGDCCGTAIGYAIMEMYNEIKDELGIEEIDFKEVEGKISKKDENTSTFIHEGKYKCPECGESLIMEGGCNSCKSCGYSKCG